MNSAVILSFLTMRHLQIKMSRCLACFLHCSCLPLETAACALTAVEIFGWQLTHSRSSSQCQRQSLLSFQSIKLKKKIWAALAFSSCKQWTLAHITSFARCSSTSVNKLKKWFYCQWNIQAWIWLRAAFIYLFICFRGRLSCLLKKKKQWKNTKVVLWKMLQCVNSTAESRTQALLCYHTAHPTIYYRSILSTEMEKKNSSTRMLLRKTTQFTCVCLKAKASYLCTNHSSVVSNSNTFSSDFLLCVITGFLLMLPKKPLPWF